MMARKLTPVVNRPALLVKPREEVRSQLVSRLEIGQEISRRPIESEQQFNQSQADYKMWDEFNEEFLRRAFSNEEYALRYRATAALGMMVLGGQRPSLQQKVSEWADRVDVRLQRISSLIDRLDLIDEDSGVSVIGAAIPDEGLRRLPSAENRKVFIVHGLDEEAKITVARFVERCGLEAIILHDQPNGGQTIIEKFEREADVGFAIVLLTPDDVGGPRGEGLTSTNLQPRARQNVILELGYFTGRLGRKRVAALKKGEVELPSDIYGVVWTSLSGDDAWKVSVVRELRAAGYEVDIARALGV